MVNLSSPESLWLTFMLGLVLLVLYGDHLWHVAQDWRHFKDARSFHHLLIGSVAEVGMLSIVVGRAVRLELIPEYVGIAVSYSLTGSLLVVGAYLAYSWHFSRPSASQRTGESGRRDLPL